jgi:dolichol-phosphate hexosyltransferase
LRLDPSEGTRERFGASAVPAAKSLLYASSASVALFMRVSYVIPSLNEREGIRKTIERVPLAYHKKKRDDVEIIVVDGLSTDGTPEVARTLGARVILETRRGYGRAYKSGLQAAKGDIVITGDADGSYPFEDSPSYIELLEKEALDFVTVNRFAALAPGSMSAKHRFGNFVLNMVTRFLFWIGLHDTQSGMWIIRRRTLDVLPLESFSDGMPFSEELKIRAFRRRDLKSKEIPGRYLPRTGEAKLSSWKDGIRNLKHLVRMRFQRSPRGNGSP